MCLVDVDGYARGYAKSIEAIPCWYEMLTIKSITARLRSLIRCND
jgi:hypothetical protein